MPSAWTLFFLLAAGQGFFQGFAFLIFRKQQPRATVALAMLMFTFSVMITFYVLYWTNLMRQFPRWNGFEVVPLLFVPAWFILYRAWLSPRTSKWVYLVFLPGLIYFIFWLPLFLRPVEALQNPDHGFKYPVPWLGYVGYLGRPVVQMIFLSLGAAAIFIWQKADRGLSPEARNWWYKIAGLYAAFVLAAGVYWVLVYTQLLKPEYDYMISATMCVFIYTVGFMAYRQSARLQPAEQERQYIKEMLLTPGAAAALEAALLGYMDNARPYLDPQLRLTQLADAIHCTPHQLSELLNVHMDTNYAAFVNGYRIREAVERLDNPQNERLTVKEVAYQTGFNNLTSFNKAFKLQTGFTPTAFRSKTLTDANTA